MNRFVLVALVAAVATAVPIYAHAQDEPALSCATAVPIPGVGLQVVGQPRVVSNRTGMSINGRVANGSGQSASGVVTVTLFDESANIVGVYTGVVNRVAANDEVTYTARGLDVPQSWATVEAKVTQLV